MPSPVRFQFPCLVHLVLLSKTWRLLHFSFYRWMGVLQVVTGGARGWTLTLGVSLELNNPKYGLALQLTSQDYEFIGWTPRYIVGDLLQAITQTPQVAARVVRVNPDDVPANRRVLVEMHGFLPANFEPMASGDFLSIGCQDARQ
jgi:hypothetical protein